MEIQRKLIRKDNGLTVLRSDLSFLPIAIQNINQFIIISTLCFTRTDVPLVFLLISMSN